MEPDHVLTQLRDQLIAATTVLSQDAVDQRRYLQHLDVGVDELALEFDDVAPAALAADGLLSEQARLLVRDLSERLGAMSGPQNARFWTVDALDGEAWGAVRRQARNLADALAS